MTSAHQWRQGGRCGARRGAAGLGAAAASSALHAAQSFHVLQPAGIQAQHIHSLWQLTLWVCTAVFAAILAVLVVAIARAARARTDADGGEPSPPWAEVPGTARKAHRAVVAATALSTVLLVGLVAADIATDRSLSRLPVDDAVHIEMVGSQWWWESRYAAADGHAAFATAGELHVPVGRPVVVTLKSADVIHTFWVPNLHGKKDMLPGRTTTIELRADRPGDYRGQCAEFCGLEHALMAFGVSAESPERFAAWQAHQAAPAAVPTEGEAVRGHALFMASNCAQCHTVRGSAADGGLGPDLTHLKSRPTIAAGSLPNAPAQLAAWIVNPQGLKPGSTMPASRLPPDDVRALVAYLETLR